MLPSTQKQSQARLGVEHKERLQIHLIPRYIPAFISVIVSLAPLIAVAEISHESENQIQPTQRSATDSVKQQPAAMIVPNSVPLQLLSSDQLAQSSRIIAQNPQRARAGQLLKQAQEVKKQQTTASYQQAISLYEQAAKLYLDIGDGSQAAQTLYYVAGVYGYILRQPQQQLTTYKRMLKIEQAEKNLDKQAIIHSFMALVYRDSLKQPQAALIAFNQALELWRTQKDLMRQASTLSYIAGVYQDIQQPEKALAAYNQALKIAQTQKDVGWQVTILDSIAYLYESVKQPEKALSIYNQALDIQRTQKDTAGQTQTQERIAEIYKNLKQPEKATSIQNQILQSQRTQKDLGGQAETLKSIALTQQTSGQLEKALATYNQLLQTQQIQKDLDGQASTLRSVAVLYRDLKQTEKATLADTQRLKVYEQLLKIQQTQKNLDRQASTLEFMGGIYNEQKQYQKALDAFNQALKLLQTKALKLSDSKTKLSSNRFDQALILTRIATTYGYLGDRPKYLSYNIKSYELRLADEKDPKETVQLLNGMQVLYIRFGENQKALAILDKMLKLQQQIKAPAKEAETLGKIADIYSGSGESQKSLDTYNRALSIQKQAADPTGQAKTLIAIAQVYRLLGDNDLRLDTYNRALQLAQKANNRTLQVDIFQELGTTYRKEKEYNKALEAYQQALVLVRSLPGDTFFSPGYVRDLNESSLQLGLGLLYEQLRDYPKALTAADRSLELSRSVDFESGPGYAFLLMSRVYLAQGAYQKAVDVSSQALKIFQQKLTLGSMDALALNVKGKAYAGLKQYSRAIETYNSALAQMRKKDNRRGEAETSYLMAVTEQKRGNLKAAQSQIEAALTVVEDLRIKVADPSLRASYFASVQEYYEFYIDLLMQLHKEQPSEGFNALALQASERARARSLLDLLNESQANIRQGIDPKLLEQEKNLQFQLNTLEKRRLELYSKNSTKLQIANFEREYNTVLSQYQDLETQIRSRSPRYAALTQPQPLTLAELKQQVLDDNTVLLEYFLGKDRSYLWAVTPSGMTSYELPKQSEIEAATQQFRKVVATPTAQTSEISKAGAPLTQMLIGPVANQLGQKRLLIVSNGALQYLPFAALPAPTGSQSLLSEHEIINLPSASTLATLRHELNGRKSAAKTVAAFADPVFSRTDQRVSKNGSASTPNNSSQKSINSLPLSAQTLRRASQDAGINFGRLPGTRQEAENILKLIPANTQTQAFDFKASRENVLNSNLSQYRIIHFATHGILNTTHPELSAVVLSLVDRKGNSQNGFLRLNDIFNLNLPAELVVLSACQTGLGQNIRGEGLIGLTRGFMYAGTPRVLVSLWNVNDESTAVLMTHFYKAMLEQNLPPAAALRAAQLKMQQEPKWRSPYYWAAFTLQGEWK